MEWDDVLKSGRSTAVVVVAGSTGVRGTIRLTTRLDPDKGIQEAVTSVGRGTNTEASALRVAPVTPLDLTGGLLARTALVGNEVSARPAILLQQRAHCVNETLLIVDGGALGIRRSAAEAPGIVVGNVGGESTERSWLAGILVDASKELRSRALVVGPAQPASMACIKIHGDVGQVQFRDSVVGQADIRIVSLGTLGNIHVGDQISQGVRLWKSCQS